MLLLADVFENFRKLYQTPYDLDITHCYTAPGLSCEACLRIRGVDLGLFTDIDMLLFIEQGVRGRVSMIYTDMQDLISRTLQGMIHLNHPSTLCTGMQTTSTDGVCLNT